MEQDLMVIFNIANYTMNLQKEQESFSKFILYVSLFLYFFFFHIGMKFTWGK